MKRAKGNMESTLKKNDLRGNLNVCLKQLPEVPPSHDPSNFTLRELSVWEFHLIYGGSQTKPGNF